MKDDASKWVGAFLLLLVAAIGSFLLLRGDGAGRPAGAGSPPQESVQKEHSVSEAVQADLISIFGASDLGASYMAGSGTEEFEALAAAISTSVPLTAVSDESFTDLLVISFGRNDTLEVSYSPDRNVLISGDRAYQPGVDVARLIANIKAKVDS